MKVEAHFVNKKVKFSFEIRVCGWGTVSNFFFVEHEVKKGVIRLFHKLGGVSQVKYSEKDFQINFFIAHVGNEVKSHSKSMKKN